jgi:glucose-1-phosphatase
MAGPVEAVLFDLGGIVLDIDFNRALAVWSQYSRLSLDSLTERFAFDRQYEQHERGELSGAAYLDHLRATLDLDADDAAIAHGWNAIFVGAISESVASVAALSHTVPCYAFSNTNKLHEAYWSVQYAHVMQNFLHVFTSSKLGMRKPEARAFEHVLSKLGRESAEVLFVDDTLTNVEGARAVGLRAAHVVSPADLRKAIADAGLV